jgi:hypothetical protein
VLFIFIVIRNLIILLFLFAQRGAAAVPGAMEG